MNWIAQPPDRLIAIVDDEADVALTVLRAGARGGKRDELVAEVDERHPARTPAKPNVVEVPLEERNSLVDVADFDGDVVDADKAGHGRTLAGANSCPAGPTVRRLRDFTVCSYYGRQIN